MVVPIINKTVLMSGADYFGDSLAINAYMDSRLRVDIEKAKAEHQLVRESLEQAGIKVIKVDPPLDCQDGVYTANWALCREDKALLSVLPNIRTAESPYAETVLTNLGKTIIKLPPGIRFSGQGDALPCGNLLFVGSNYRTDEAVFAQIRKVLSYDVVGLQTIPKKTRWFKRPVINKVSGWPDSYFYDIDLALSIIKPDLIAYCPEAFAPKSQKILASLQLNKIIVDYKEATEGFACNLISTGETVVMSAHAPMLKTEIEKHGLKTITPEVNELGKGGGYIRCCALTLDNF